MRAVEQAPEKLRHATNFAGLAQVVNIGSFDVDLLATTEHGVRLAIAKVAVTRDHGERDSVPCVSDQVRQRSNGSPGFYARNEIIDDNERSRASVIISGSLRVWQHSYAWSAYI